MNNPARIHFFPVLAFLLAALVPLSVAGQARADIIPKDMKPIYVSAILENMGDYPDYAFVQLETLGDEVRAAEVVRPGRGVIRGYKLNRLEILAVPKSLIADAGGIENVDLMDDKAILRSGDVSIESGQQLVPRPSSMAGKEVHYAVRLAAGRVELEKTGEQIFDEHPNDYPVNLFLYGFIVTLGVELILFIAVIRLLFRRREPGAVRSVVVVAVAQAATLPVLWFMITRYDLMGTGVMLGAESFAVAVESVVYRFLAGLTWRQAFIAALLCNAASYVVGMMA